MAKKVILGTDHRGWRLKERLKEVLAGWGYEYEDKGAFQHDAKDDYPDFIAPVARLISLDPGLRGIVLGYSGQGEALLANKFPNVRAAVYYGGPLELVRLTREHNDANVLSLGASYLDNDTAIAAVKIWLGTAFSEDERHVRRLDKVAEYDQAENVCDPSLGGERGPTGRCEPLP